MKHKIACGDDFELAFDDSAEAQLERELEWERLMESDRGYRNPNWTAPPRPKFVQGGLVNPR